MSVQNCVLLKKVFLQRLSQSFKNDSVSLQLEILETPAQPRLEHFSDRNKYYTVKSNFSTQTNSPTGAKGSSEGPRPGNVIKRNC